MTGEIVVKDNKTQQDQIKYVYKIFLGERFCREEGCASTTVYKRTTHLTQHYRRKHDGAGNIPEGKQTIGHPPNDLDIQAALEFYTTWRSAFLDNGQPANYVQDDIAFVLDQGGSKREKMSELVEQLVNTYGHSALEKVKSYQLLPDNDRWPMMEEDDVWIVNLDAAKRSISLTGSCDDCETIEVPCDGTQEECALYLRYGDPSLAEWTKGDYDLEALQSRLNEFE